MSGDFLEVITLRVADGPVLNVPSFRLMIVPFELDILPQARRDLRIGKDFTNNVYMHFPRSDGMLMEALESALFWLDSSSAVLPQKYAAFRLEIASEISR